MPGVAKSTIREASFTLRDHPYVYFQLQLISVSPRPLSKSSSSSSSSLSLDEITLRQYLVFALNQSFGLVGSAVGIDILKVEDANAWIRTQSQDANLLSAALSQWRSANGQVSLRIVGRTSWLGGLGNKEEEARLWSLER